jgi:hypothetical protein
LGTFDKGVDRLAIEGDLLGEVQPLVLGGELEDIELGVQSKARPRLSLTRRASGGLKTASARPVATRLIEGPNSKRSRKGRSARVSHGTSRGSPREDA